MTVLRTEADVVATLAAGTYQLPELYELVEVTVDVARDGGRDLVQDGQPRWQRRVRGALQYAKRTGRAQRIRTGLWAITHGTATRPRRVVLIMVAGAGEPTHLELLLADAAELFTRLDEPADLICADPPYGLGRGGTDPVDRRVYRRDQTRIVPGYVDVDPGCYAEFTHRWITAAAAALRPGGYLAVITGAQQAARVQVTAEDAGLTYVNAITVARPFALRTTRRFAHAHWVVTLLTAGPLNSPMRFFAVPPELPKARSGRDYPLDWWPDIGKYERPNRLRYDNALPPTLIRRIVLATTRGPEHGAGELVVDPFIGSGTTALVCLETGRRFVGGDRNPEALRFTMARLLAEHLWRPVQLTLDLDRG